MIVNETTEFNYKFNYGEQAFGWNPYKIRGLKIVEGFN